jgi:hypothetical protein
MRLQMAGYELTRMALGRIEVEVDSGNVERAVKHWIIAASAGCYRAMYALRKHFTKKVELVSRDAIDSILIANNTSCAKM